MKIEQSHLENGLETVFVNSPGSTAATVQIWFKAGSALESKDEQGIAHFLEHMFFKGSANRPGNKIAHEVEAFGGEINAFTSFDYTCYYINTPVSHINQSVDILLDMVANPLFGENELKPERDVVHEEYKRSWDNPSQYNFKEIQETCFTDGYAHQILGTEQTIQNFSRDQLISFRNRYYNLSNSMLIVAGNISNTEKLSEIINKYKLPAGPRSHFPNFVLSPKGNITAHQKDVKQITCTITIPAPHYGHDDVCAEDLALNAIAHGESSILYHTLVSESSLANSISGSTMYFHFGGAHFLRFSCPPENYTKTLQLLEKILKDVLKEGLDESEISKIKNQYVASKIYERETVESFAFNLGHGFAQNGDIHCEEEFIGRLKNTATKHVNRGLKQIFSKPMHITIQVPKNIKVSDIKKEAKEFSQNLQTFIADKPLSKKFVTKSVKSKFDPTVHEINIEEGIKLIYRQNLMTPTFVLHAYLKGGLSAENEKNCGIHGLLGRSLCYGYDKTSYDELKLDLDNKTAFLSGFSGKNAYGLQLHGQSEHTEELMSHFFGTLFSPQLPTKYINLEKKLVLRSLENQSVDPVKQCLKTFQKIIFKGHPYSLDSLGTVETIKKIQNSDLLKIHQQALKKSPLVITYCGDHELEEILPTVKHFCKQLKPRVYEKTVLQKVGVPKSTHAHIPFTREQTHIFLGKQSPSLLSKEDIYLRILTAHLSGQSSDLFSEIRDKQGLCYTIQPVHHSALEVSYWGIYIGTGNEKVKQAIDAIKLQLGKLQAKGLSKSEFNAVKTMLEGQTLLNTQTNEDHANLYSISSLHKIGLDFQHQQNQKINETKLEDFNKFLSKFLSDQWILVTSGQYN